MRDLSLPLIGAEDTPLTPSGGGTSAVVGGSSEDETRPPSNSSKTEQLNSSLYATSFLANQNQRGRTCQHHCVLLNVQYKEWEPSMLTSLYVHALVYKVSFNVYCMETDHASQSCALAPPSTGRNLGDSRSADRGHSDRRWRDPASCVKMACFDWNDGKCSSPYCRFKHVCATCGVKCTGAKPEKCDC